MQRVDPPNQPLLLRGLPAPLLRVIILLLSQGCAPSRTVSLRHLFPVSETTTALRTASRSRRGNWTCPPPKPDVPVGADEVRNKFRCAPQLMCARLPIRKLFSVTLFFYVRRRLFGRNCSTVTSRVLTLPSEWQHPNTHRNGTRDDEGRGAPRERRFTSLN